MASSSAPLFPPAGVPVDPAWNRKHDENQWEVRRLQVSALLVAVVAVVAAVALVWLTDGATWAWVVGALAALFALGSLAMIAVIPRSMGSPRRRYAEGMLVPAVVADVRPRGLTLLALVDRASDPAEGPRPALVTRNCEKLDGHQVRVGERVPCVAVGANRSRTHTGPDFQFVTVSPVAWATGRPSVAQECAARIPEARWEELRAQQRRLSEVEQSPDRMLAL